MLNPADNTPSPAHGEIGAEHVVFLGDRPRRACTDSPRTGTSHRRERPASLDPASAAFFEALCGAGGVRSTRYRNGILLRRQAACLRALRVACPVEGARVLRSSPEVAGRALGAVMIGVTGFFRDPPVFRALRGLIQTLRRKQAVDVLSVACSDGSELYSVAMLLAENGLLKHSRLWGLDCRADAIAAAEQGVYPADSLDDMPATLRARCFRPVRGTTGNLARAWQRGPAVQVADFIRSACSWITADAFALSQVRGLPAAYDIILCRNLAIYLTADSSEELWASLVSRLKPGGFLVVGKAERPSARVRDCLVKVDSCIYRKASGA